jgi:hypothetical protein
VESLAGFVESVLFVRISKFWDDASVWFDDSSGITKFSATSGFNVPFQEFSFLFANVTGCLLLTCCRDFNSKVQLASFEISDGRNDHTCYTVKSKECVFLLVCLSGLVGEF